MRIMLTLALLFSCKQKSYIHIPTNTKCSSYGTSFTESTPVLKGCNRFDEVINPTDIAVIYE